MEHKTPSSETPLEEMTKKEALKKFFLRRIRQKKWPQKCGDSYTPVGIIYHYINDLSTQWKKPSTIAEYASQYIKTLLPALNEKKDAGIEDIYKADYDNAIKQIADDKIKKDGIPYADSTIAHFKYLFRILVLVAYNHHHCSDCFWASDYDPPAELSEQELNETFLPRSLSAKQSAKVIYALTIDPVTMPGEWPGLLLMASCDFRDNEACAPTYGDIVPRAEVNCAWVINTKKGATNYLKIGGKSPNSERAFPLPEKTNQVIAKRKAHIINYVNTHYGDVIRDHPDYNGLDAEEIVNRLPIVCRGFDYFRGISAARLSDAGRDFFRFIGFDKKEFYLADMASSSALIVNAGYDLKNPSSYLLRRDCATVMRILGLSEPEILFLMGHKIENSILARNDFLNESELQHMDRELSQRPVLNTISPNEITVSSSSPLPCNYNVMPNDLFTVSTQSDEDMLIIFTAQEPGDSFSVRVYDKDGTEMSIPVSESYSADVYTGFVNTIQQFQNNFIKAYNRLTRSKNAPHPSKYLPEKSTPKE